MISRLAEAVRIAVLQTDLAERLRPLGFRAVLSEPPEAMARLIREDTPRWQNIVQASGVTLD